MRNEADIRKDIAKLRTQMKRLRYSDPLVETEYQQFLTSSDRLMQGSPGAYLPLVHYVLLEGSKRVAKFISSQGYDLDSKSDYKFIESVYEILRIHFNCKPVCSLTQFFAEGYGEFKVRFLLDIATAVMAKHNALAQLSPKPKTPLDKSLNYSGHSHLSLIPSSSLVATPSKDAKSIDEQFLIQSKTYDASLDLDPGAGTELARSKTVEERKTPKTVEPPAESEPEIKLVPEMSLEQIHDLLRELKATVKNINGKVEKIQDSVGLKLANIQAEVVLLNGKLNFIENNIPPKSAPETNAK